MASDTTELESGLQEMSALKAPGVSGTRIGTLTAFCVANVQSESVLVQKIYTHFKKTAGTHKLGVLYVVDSVTRKWLDLAKAEGQTIDGSSKDGTYAAGIHRMRELMPLLMNDIIQSAPPTHKDKINKLLDIWEKGQTFSQDVVDTSRTKLNAAPVQDKSTTPAGSPPPSMRAFYNDASSVQQRTAGIPQPAQPAPPTIQGSNAIMEALAKLTSQATSTASQPPPLYASPPIQVAPLLPPPQAPVAIPSNLVNLLSSLAKQTTPVQAQPPFFPPQNYQTPVAPQPVAPQSHMPYPYPNAAPAYGNNGLGAYPTPAAPAANPPPAGGFPANMQDQVKLIKALADQGIPFDQIPAVIQKMQAAGSIPIAGAPGGPQQPSLQPYGSTPAWGQTSDMARSSERSSRRSRSRSPGRRRDGRQDHMGDRRFNDSHGSRGSEYRQRSPVGHRQGGDPMNPPAHRGEDKWVEYDRTLPEGNIRVFSRTLFVGGVICPEKELRDIFGQYGEVQTCIVNRDKRHAFVKMVTRKDAVAAKEAMEFPQGPNGLQLRTRWGVGFGPRHCSDYSNGISVIPISALTEADRKWMLTAEIGGSGGRPIESGLVVEEPDIEIGAGVSSKAISRRMQTDKSGSQGPRSTRTGDSGWRGRGGRREDNQASGANAQPLPQQHGVNGGGGGGMSNFAQYGYPNPY
ncbi:hypothetical protein F5X68DRAFT_34983 [Plectosphaerella plurivora]|uniref:Uncharacterized protein n=1 Tax=Plectosphaerella plurivora TaxID=936078 RepID=A0A9P8V7M0_9PEZI|nr:hypothetical protein F5X68DRAFT_34983 [Plectosphaerella plurivora]